MPPTPSPITPVPALSASSPFLSDPPSSLANLSSIRQEIASIMSGAVISGALPSDSSLQEPDVHKSHEHAEDRSIAIVYSKNRYKQDAAIISVLKAELDNGGFLHLRDV